jgi:hypothetical protein
MKQITLLLVLAMASIGSVSAAEDFDAPPPRAAKPQAHPVCERRPGVGTHRPQIVCQEVPATGPGRQASQDDLTVPRWNDELCPEDIGVEVVANAGRCRNGSGRPVPL